MMFTCSLFASQGSLALVPEGMWQNNNNPIYNGAKPEYPCSVFLAAFSVLRRKNGELSYTALRPTSIRFSRDAKTATRDASAKIIREIPLRQPCFPDNNAIFAEGCQGARGGSATECNGLYRRSSAHERQ